MDEPTGKKLTGAASIWEPWERKGDESDEAYEAFHAYLMTVPKTDRSNRRTAEKVGKAVSLIGKWASEERHDWVKRAALYDSHCFRVEQKGRDKEAAKSAALWERRKNDSREQLYDISQNLLEKAKAMLAKPLERQTTKKDGVTVVHEPAKWTQATAINMVRAAADIQRTAIGDALDDDGFNPLTATGEECKAYLAKKQADIAAMRRLETAGSEE